MDLIESIRKHNCMRHATSVLWISADSGFNSWLGVAFDWIQLSGTLERDETGPRGSRGTPGLILLHRSRSGSFAPWSNRESALSRSVQDR